MADRFRPLLRWFTLTLVSASVGLAATAIGQSFDDDPSSGETRDQLYEEVAREVAALERQGNLLRKVVRLVRPTVVHIEARRTDERLSRKPVEEAGSGVIVNLGRRVCVLTNRHVIDDTPLESIDITLADGRLIRARKKWTDPSTDVAVLAVSAGDLTPARIGNSEQVEIGDFVLAVGSPFGLSHSITYGIISAKGRRDLELGDGNIRYQDFLQTDAAINPGNSGGPLISLRGEVIGLNTAIASSSGGSEGIGFTIPINMAIATARQLVEHGRTLRAYLGVTLSTRFGPAEATRMGMLRPRGALVSGVKPDSPAATAALRPRDVVVEFDGYRIDDDNHLIKVVGFTEIGKEVRLVVVRAGKLLELRVKVADRSEFPGQ